MNQPQLKGVLCPSCGSAGPFRFTGCTEFLLTEHGAVSSGPVIPLSAEMGTCVSCGYEAVQETFVQGSPEYPLRSALSGEAVASPAAFGEAVKGWSIDKQVGLLVDCRGVAWEVCGATVRLRRVPEFDEAEALVEFEELISDLDEPEETP